MDNIKGIPYRLGEYNKHTVGVVESAIDLGESVCLCHNSGSYTIFLSGETGVSTDSCELLPGDRIYLAGIVYVISTNTTYLKAQQLITAYI